MTNWKILVADDLAPEGLEILRAAGEVTVRQGMSLDELVEALPGTHALIVRSATKVTAAALRAADQLLVVGRAGIGVDNVDIAAATERGIVVMNTPESGATTTAEHAIAMLLALARKIPAADALMHAGRWQKKALTGVEITGKTLGLVGLGRIGRVVADRAKGLRMNVIAYDPFVTPDRVPEGVQLVDFERCLAEADFVSIHVPLSEETKGLLDDRAFGLVKPGMRLVHCARGGIVDEAALLRALDAGQVAGAALDVFEREPLEASDPLVQRSDVVLTPHLGASTEEAREAVARDIAKQVVTCLETGTVVNGINVPRIAPRDADYLTPFLTLAQRLASLLTQVFEGKLERVSIDLQGASVKEHEDAMRLAALVGALRGRGLNATPVNAPALAAEHAVDCDSTLRVVAREFMDFIRVEVVVDGASHFASGTNSGRHGFRLLDFEQTRLDARLGGSMLLTRHVDQPGVIGRIGTLLGDANVNISRMQLGLRGEGSEALGLLNLDAPVPADLLATIRSLDFVRTACSVELPGNGV